MTVFLTPDAENAFWKLDRRTVAPLRDNWSRISAEHTD